MGGNSEARNQEEILLSAARHNRPLWRNNSGAFKDETGRLIRFGLGHVSQAHNKVWKSPDLVGITPMTIKHHHVGRVVGVFTGVEVKRENWSFKDTAHEMAQYNCLAEINKRGGFGMFARTVKEYENVIKSLIF